MDPKSNHQCAHKREAEGDLTEVAGGSVTGEARYHVICF